MNLLYDTLNYWMEQLDPRSADLPLIGSSYQVPLIIFAYLYFVLRCGPRFMKNRPPYSLKTFIKLYNIVQILGNVWLIYVFSDIFIMYNLACPVVDYSYSYNTMRLIRGMWYYFLLKILDYIETVIFVLRKKDNQTSGLHLYHHVSTLLLTWQGTRSFNSSPTLAFVALLNCIIHAMMYTYYFLAAWGPSVQKAIAPMKQWITISQMVQFIVMSSYITLQEFVLDCRTLSNLFALSFLANLVINFYMFYNFYQKSYKKIKKIQ